MNKLKKIKITGYGIFENIMPIENNCLKERIIYMSPEFRF